MPGGRGTQGHHEEHRRRIARCRQGIRTRRRPHVRRQRRGLHQSGERDGRAGHLLSAQGRPRRLRCVKRDRLAH